jgi:hypothetical protein
MLMPLRHFLLDLMLLDFHCFCSYYSCCCCSLVLLIWMGGKALLAELGVVKAILFIVHVFFDFEKK